jgi:hypothetical protein
MPSQYDAMIDGYESEGQDASGYGKKKKEAHKVKLRRIDEAQKLLKDNKWLEKWNNFIKLYSNQYPYPELGDYDDKVAPNMAFSTVNVIVPSIAVHSPKIVVSAKREEDAETADVVEAVVNHQWKQHKVQEEIADAIKDFCIIGHGWLKVVWDTKTEQKDLSVEEWQMSAQQAIMERQQAVEQSGLSEDEFPTIEEVLEALPRKVEVVTKDAPKVRRISPFDMVVDPDANSMNELRWIAQRSLVPLETARKKEEWKSSVRRKLKAAVLSDARKDVDVYGGEKTETKDAAFVVVWEYYDLLDETVCVMAEGTDDYLLEPTESPFPWGHPYVFVENYKVPERFYPVGDVEPIYGLQIELAMTRTQMINDRKRGRRMHLYRSAAIGPDGVDKLTSGKDNVLIDVLEDRPFTDVFQSITPVGLTADWYAQSDAIQRDIDIVSGISEYARGAMPEIRRTATEAGLIQDNANARSADKLYKVEQAMARVAEHMIVLSQMFMDSEDVARVVDDELVVSWVPYDREALKGDFVFEVEAGSSQPQNETFRRQSALQMMDAMGPFLQMGVVNPAMIAEHVLRNGFGVRNAEEFLAAPAPMEDEMGGVPPEEGGVPPEGMMAPGMMG